MSSPLVEGAATPFRDVPSDPALGYSARTAGSLYVFSFFGYHVWVPSLPRSASVGFVPRPDPGIRASCEQAPSHGIQLALSSSSFSIDGRWDGSVPSPASSAVKWPTHTGYGLFFPEREDICLTPLIFRDPLFFENCAAVPAVDETVSTSRAAISSARPSLSGFFFPDHPFFLSAGFLLSDSEIFFFQPERRACNATPSDDDFPLGACPPLCSSAAHHGTHRRFFRCGICCTTWGTLNGCLPNGGL